MASGEPAPEIEQFRKILIGDVPTQMDARLVGAPGVIVVSGHIGNWESLGEVLQRRFSGRPRALIAHRHPNARIASLFEATRRRLGMETVYQDQSPRRALRLLR